MSQEELIYIMEEWLEFSGNQDNAACQALIQHVKDRLREQELSFAMGRPHTR